MGGTAPDRQDGPLTFTHSEPLPPALPLTRPRALPQPLAATLLEAILGTAVLAGRAGRHVPAMDPSGTPQRGTALQRDRDRALLETVRRAG